MPETHEYGTVGVDNAFVIADPHDPEGSPEPHLADVIYCDAARLPGGIEQWFQSVFDRFPGCLAAVVGGHGRGCVVQPRGGRPVRTPLPPPRPGVRTGDAWEILVSTLVRRSSPAPSDQ
ncbi:hypothetical protein [Allonocardiopsis opalescens]|uniref:Uncharacterized protein n=1 Tax=Allonocardiopsis opalescens TaxID=1144618 RepID=A0A2T0PXK7_9ACTN|nr:hypothetical protein [Allonocardiopsis opalescens]PRX96259.1 hypothetical protein CLV72_108266 [Allonocardiopsis opalescens]